MTCSISEGMKAKNVITFEEYRVNLGHSLYRRISVCDNVFLRAILESDVGRRSSILMSWNST